MSIGHTRYSTIGKINKLDIQPMLETYPYGAGAVHNGNIENIEELSIEVNLEDRFLFIFQIPNIVTGKQEDQSFRTRGRARRRRYVCRRYGLRYDFG